VVPSFRLLGFPVRVRFGFFVFAGLLIVWSPTIGWRFLIAVTVFSLIHELGHALAARRLGAEPEITLDFLAGTTSYVPPQHLTPIDRAVVAAAGPALETAVGLVVLAALRVNPLSIDQVFDSTVATQVWIAGPLFGLLNLLPVLPLDGGHVLSGALETFWPRVGRRLTLAVGALTTVGLVIVTLAAPRWRWLTPLSVTLVVLQGWLAFSRVRGRRRAESAVVRPDAVCASDEQYPAKSPVGPPVR
jgi:Zn-dependent protease